MNITFSAKRMISTQSRRNVNINGFIPVSVSFTTKSVQAQTILFPNEFQGALWILKYGLSMSLDLLSSS
jgi:hypothetical protein